MGKNKDKTWKPLATIITLILITNCITQTPTQTNQQQKTETKPITILHNEYSQEKLRMIQEDLMGRDITDKKVLEAMAKVPRHLFVPKKYRNQAYADHPLPIGYGQTISQPYVVALMTQALELKPQDKVLEIGTGSGYQAAILAEIVKEVYTIEIIPELAERARKTLESLGYNVQVKTGDGYYGWEEKAPFDAIIVTAAASHIPPPLLEQLKEGGRLIIPLGSTKYYQTLTLIKKKDGKLETKHLTTVRFVPMTGKIQEKS
ncbi:MAG: protein-L-isoaspartate O-methyltransferase [Methanobacteriota archaeon]|nr:MAG: protein-L-isoaspartate O-methyltransferase [Euryarchaeota archaeon]